MARIPGTKDEDPEVHKFVATAIEAIMDVEQLLRQRQSQSRRQDAKGTFTPPRRPQVR
jgi:hypothetical protein